MDSLTTAAAKVGLLINCKKTEALTVCTNLTANITCQDRNGFSNPLPRCSHFRYLEGRMPSAQEEPMTRKETCSYGFPQQFTCLCAVPKSSGQLWYWYSPLKSRDLNPHKDVGEHSSLLKTSFSVARFAKGHTPRSVCKAGDDTPSSALQQRWLHLVGHHVIRTQDYNREPLQKAQLLTQPVTCRRGQGRLCRLLKLLFEDTETPGDPTNFSLNVMFMLLSFRLVGRESPTDWKEGI